MCLAVPGKIVEIKKDVATVDYICEKRKGKLLEKGFKEGDYVIIQGGIVLQKIPNEEAKEALRLYNLSIKD